MSKNTNKSVRDMYETVKPFVDKMKARYPKELNLDGLEPALTSDIAEICLVLVSLAKEEQREDLIEYLAFLKVEEEKYIGFLVAHGFHCPKETYEKGIKMRKMLGVSEEQVEKAASLIRSNKK